MIELMDYTIEVCEKEDVTKIVDGINQYNSQSVPALAAMWTPLEFVARNKEGVEVGGILGGIGCWNGLEIRVLWVKEEYRNLGIGARLLTYMEREAMTKGAMISMLDTFDFQAERFYLKNGYSVVGEIKDFPPNHRRIYFSKKLK